MSEQLTCGECPVAMWFDMENAQCSVDGQKKPHGRVCDMSNAQFQQLIDDTEKARLIVFGSERP
jgi:CxxC motif-containing protein